jgi:hypothetical protein
VTKTVRAATYNIFARPSWRRRVAKRRVQTNIMHDIPPCPLRFLYNATGDAPRDGTRINRLPSPGEHLQRCIFWIFSFSFFLFIFSRYRAVVNRNTISFSSACLAAATTFHSTSGRSKAVTGN